MCNTKQIFIYKTIFSLNHQFLCWSPEGLLKVSCRSGTLEPLGDLQGTSPGCPVPTECLTMLSVNINNIAIFTIKNVDYRSIIHNISKSEASNLLRNSVVEDRGYIYKNIVLNFSLLKVLFLNFFCFSIYKMVDTECSIDIYKSGKISIGTVMRNPDS